MNSLLQYVTSLYVTAVLLLVTTSTAAVHPLSSPKFHFNGGKIKVNDPVLDDQIDSIRRISANGPMRHHIRNMIKLNELHGVNDDDQPIPANLFRVVLKILLKIFGDASGAQTPQKKRPNSSLPPTRFSPMEPIMPPPPVEIKIVMPGMEFSKKITVAPNMKIGPTLGQVLRQYGYSRKDVVTEDMAMADGTTCTIINRIGDVRRDTLHEFIVVISHFSQLVYEDDCIPVNKFISVGHSIQIVYV